MLPETAIFRTDFNPKGANAMTESFISVKDTDFLEKIILLAYTAPRAAGWGVNAEKLTALRSLLAAFKTAYDAAHVRFVERHAARIRELEQHTQAVLPPAG